MPHRLEYLIDKPFTSEEDRPLAGAWAAKLDRDSVGERAASGLGRFERTSGSSQTSPW